MQSKLCCRRPVLTIFELKDYAKAEQYFAQLKTITTSQDTKLESMRGLLRCQYKLSQFDAMRYRMRRIYWLKKDCNRR